MICTSLADCNYEEIVQYAKKFEMVEIRIDLLDIEIEKLCSLTEYNKNIIATCRPGKFTDDERMILLKKMIDASVKYVDIEIDASESYKAALIAYAKEKKVLTVISYHDFEKTPPRRELEEVVKWFEDLKGDICKIACMVKSKKDAAVLLSMYEYDRSIVSLGMGDEGKITRIASLLLGAPFTFAGISDSNKTAPGQISSEKIDKIMELIQNV